jgi:hypothetical protein
MNIKWEDHERHEKWSKFKIFKAYENLKFLIHCGYDHLNEGIPGIAS